MNLNRECHIQYISSERNTRSNQSPIVIKTHNKRKQPFPQKMVKGEYNQVDWARKQPSHKQTISGVIKECTICGDKATGIHYGALTCEGCKNFFRRSVMRIRKQYYICSKANNCNIKGTDSSGNKKRGGKCQACRYNACINAGMIYHEQYKVYRAEKQAIEQLKNERKTNKNINEELEDKKQQLELYRIREKRFRKNIEKCHNLITLMSKEIEEIKTMQLQKINYQNTDSILRTLLQATVRPEPIYHTLLTQPDHQR